MPCKPTSSAPATGRRAKRPSFPLNRTSPAGRNHNRPFSFHMTLDVLLDSIPEYAKDLKLNLSTLMRQTELTPQQAWGTVLATAVASRNAFVLDVISAEARGQLSPEAFTAAKSAAAIMGMNNIYYRFLHLA